MATALLQITRVDDSVRGRSGPYLYFWGITYNLRRLQLLIELFVETIRHNLEMKSPPPLTSVQNNKQIYCVLINNQWHRALLMELKMNPVGTLEVFCIDSGGTYLVHLACVRTLDIVGYEAETLRTWPALATKFMLADVVAPCSAESLSRHWSEEAMLFLKAQLENHTWKSELTGMYGTCQGVKLFDSRNQSLASIMVQQGFGIAIQTSNQSTEIYSSILRDIMGKHAVYSEPYSQFETSLRKASTSFMFPSTHDPQQVFSVTLPTLSDVPTTIPSVKPVERNVALRASSFGMPVVELAAEESLYVSFAGKPGYFYGQLEKMCETVVTMTAELKEAYASKPNPTLFADTKSHLMEFGVVKMEDREMYYRVLVIKELESHVEVMFIDYGNKFLVLRKQVLYPLDCLTHFCQPPGGIQCKMDSSETLSISAWKSIITGKRIKVRIGKWLDGIYSVTFTKDPCNEEVAKILLRSRSQTPTTPILVAQVENGGDLTKDISLDDSIGTNSISKDMDQKPVGSDRVSVSLPVEDVITSMTEKCCVEEKPMAKPAIPPITAHRQLMYLEQQILSDANRKIEVVFVDNPSSFYVHLSDNCTVIDDLAEKLNIIYADESKPAIKDAKPGSPCVVRFEEDRRWYRGQIDKYRETQSTDSLVNVLFVDYGNIQSTSLDQIKVIDEEFLELPPQAFHCRLDGIDVSRTWTVEEEKEFETHIIGKTVPATFAARDSDAKYPVVLVGVKSGSKLDIKDNFVIRNPTITEQPTRGYTALAISKTPMDVNITWYYNPNRFFISPVDLTAYQNVLEEFEKYYSSLIPNELIENNPSVGLSCVARFMEDGRYYRSQILSIQDQIANIIFVDYGNEQHTPLSQLKRMHERFMEFPQLAWHCKLKGVKKACPINPEARKHLAACFVIGQTATAVFQPPESDGNKEVLEVNLSVPKIGDVSQYLIEHKILERISLKNEVKIMPQVMNFTPGQIISAHAIAVDVVSPTEFSILLEPEAFQDIMDRICLLTVDPDFIKKKNFKASIGEPCLALFPEDGLWYRAVIKAIDGDDVEVYYIDYGHNCVVKSSNLLELPSDLARIPALAFKCCLDVSQALPDAAAKAFQSVVVGLPNMIVRLIKMVDGILHVHLSSNAGVDLKKLFSTAESAIASALEEKVQAATETKTSGTLELEGIISYYSSSNTFWFQLKKNLADMNAMENSLTGLYPKVIKSHRVKTKPEVNQIYGVYHPVYFVWQRACIEKCSDDTAEVYFLDYGDCQTVPISNIGYLPRRFRNVPPFAVRCYLKNVWKTVELTTRVLAMLDAVCLNPDTACRVVLERQGSQGIPFVVSFFVGDQDIFELLAAVDVKEKSLKLAQLIDHVGGKGWMGEELLHGLEVPPFLQYLDLI